MRKLLALSLLLVPVLLLAQASYNIVTVPFSLFPNFVTGNGSTLFNFTLTGNVISSSLNGGSLGMEIIFNVCQDGVGNHSFPWPPNVSGPPPILQTANACTIAKFINNGGFNWVPSGTNSLNSAAATTGTFTNLTVSGMGTFTGPFTTKNLWAEVYAASFPGATCGDKINAAVASGPANGLLIDVNQACGTGTALVPWAAVTLQIDQVIRFVEPGNYFHSGITCASASCGITSLFPCPRGPGSSVPCSVTLTEGNALNLPAAITLSGAEDFIQDVSLDGNSANNPTGGVIVKINLANRVELNRLSIQHGATHGIWIVSTGVSNQSCCAQISYVNTQLNNGSGILIQGSADVFDADTEHEANGISGTVNTSASTVTWVSGTKWSSDSSLVGAHIRINDALLCVISAVASQTSLTVSGCYNGSTMGNAPGTLNGVTFAMGNGLELNDSPTIRINHDDFGISKMDGILSTGTAAGLGGNGMMCCEATQLGSGFQHDIEIIGSDIVTGATVASNNNKITGTQFLGACNRTPNNTYDDIKLVDSGNNTIWGDMLGTCGAGAPHAAAFGISAVETVSSRATGNQIGGNSTFQGQTFGTGIYQDTTFSGVIGQTMPVRGNAGAPAAFCLTDISSATNPTWCMRSAGGANPTFSFLNPGFGTVFGLTNSLMVSSTGPTISSGFGTTPTIPFSNGSLTFRVNVGTGGVASSGVIGMPTAVSNWNCSVYNLTAHAGNRADDTVMTASNTTTITVQNQTKSTGAAVAWTANDIVVVICAGE